MATATPASLRTAAGRGDLRVRGRPCLPSPQGAPTRSRQRPHHVPPQAPRGGKGGRRPPASGRGKGSHRKECPSKGFVLPFHRHRGGKRYGSRASRTRASPQRAAGREKPSAGNAAEGAWGPPQQRLLPLQVALEAPAEARTEAQTLGAAGARRLPQAEELPTRSSLHPRRRRLLPPVPAFPCPCHSPPLLPPPAVPLMHMDGRMRLPPWAR